MLYKNITELRKALDEGKHNRKDVTAMVAQMEGTTIIEQKPDDDGYTSLYAPRDLAEDLCELLGIECEWV